MNAGVEPEEALRHPRRAKRVLDLVASMAATATRAEVVLIALQNDDHEDAAGWRVGGFWAADLPRPLRLQVEPDLRVGSSTVWLDRSSPTGWRLGGLSDQAPELRRERQRDSLQEREEERRRWARELHDDTLQQLGALQVLLTSAERGVGSTGDSDPAPSGRSPRAPLEQAVSMVAGQIDSLRHLINELRPAAFDELGLRPPLEALAERTERLTGIRVEMEVSLPYAYGQVSTRLLPDIELAVYRVAQEALANAARHSGGDLARVVVVEEDGQIRVEVSDNGCGPGQLVGFGIDGMRERAVLAGGHLQVLPGRRRRREDKTQSKPGTVVRMVVPAIHRAVHGDDAGSPHA